jgi:hypothetical protein
MFGLGERFIGAKMLEVGREHSNHWNRSEGAGVL